MKLVYNASEWKRWWSMRFIIATAFFSSVTAAYILLPPDWLPEIDGWMKKGLALATLASAGAAGVARVVKQKDVSPGGG